MSLPKWFAMVAFPLGVPSVDGKIVEFGEDTELWVPPRISLIYSVPGRLAGQLVGHIDSVYRDVDEIRATGTFHLDTEAGEKVASRCLTSGPYGLPVGAGLGPIRDSDGLAGPGGSVHRLHKGAKIVLDTGLVLRAVTVAPGRIAAWESARMWRV